MSDEKPKAEELDELGFSRTKHCETCTAHLYWSDLFGTGRWICLNGCHLKEAQKRKFQRMMSLIEEEIRHSS